MLEMKNAYKISVQRPERKMSLGRPRRWKKETVCEGVDRIMCRDDLCEHNNEASGSRCGKVLDQLSDC
jgi:hypothetical protein